MRTVVFIHDEYDESYEQGYSLGLKIAFIPDPENTVVDMTGVPARIINRNFFHGVLRAINKYNRVNLQPSRNMKWIFKHEFQLDKAIAWMNDIVIDGRIFASIGKKPTSLQRRKKIEEKRGLK